MSKNKYWVLGGGLLAIGLIAGAAISFLMLSQHDNSNPGQQFDSQQAAAASQSDTSTTPAAGSLSVGATGGANSLGQIGGTQSQSSGSQQSQSGGNSSASNEPNPATFKDYEKYKDSANALFGDIKVGTGATLASNQKAAVYYKGWLTNGQVFDQSKAGSDGKLEPFVFTLGAHQVITGWEQGTNGMKVGGSRLIIVPPSVGYGATAQGSIPANSVLVFEVQLLAVQ